jgi:toxin YoeB
VILFESSAWERYLEWQALDLKKLKKLNGLIKECLRIPFSGTGEPEPLKGEYNGFWSRRIDDEHRLVYSYEYGKLTIIACRYHYND